jgi:hypothetical protein
MDSLLGSLPPKQPRPVIRCEHHIGQITSQCPRILEVSPVFCKSALAEFQRELVTTAATLLP